MNNRKPTSEEGRRRKRLPPHLDRRITWRKVTQPKGGGEPSGTATALDISRTGLCLLVGESFDLGQAVLIAYRDHHYDRTVELAGTVRWANPDGSDLFRIGIELEEELSPHQLRLLTRLTRERPA
jgi:hypothetical protein